MTDTPSRAAFEPTYLRDEVGRKLGRDPIAYVRELRASEEPPMAWNRIAQRIIDETEIYLTQEAVRRWIRKDDERRAAAAVQPDQQAA